MPISTLGMMCLACVGMSEAPANMTGLSAKAPAMIQLASSNYRPGIYNVDRIAMTYTPKGNAVRLKSFDIRRVTTYSYRSWVNDLENLQYHLDEMGVNAKKNPQAKNRYDHLLWYLWKSAAVGNNTDRFLDYWKTTTNRDLGDVHKDEALIAALKYTRQVTYGYKGNIR